MNRNEEYRFDLAPQVESPRSRFRRRSQLKTSFNVGDLVPIYLDEVLPGDTFEMKTSKVLRLQTLQTPVMDNMYLDLYYFFVPNRLVWSHWKELMGENSDSAWIPQVQYSVPQITSPSGGWTSGTIADYFGIPTGVSNLSVNALPIRAYSLICENWFRDQNNSQPLNIPVTDSTVVGSNGSNYVSDTAKGGAPFKVAKIHDYFTSCLPAPQKSIDTPLPLGNISPVFAGDINTDFTFPEYSPGFHQPLILQDSDQVPNAQRSGDYNVTTYSDNTHLGRWAYGRSSASGTLQKGLYPVNLYADLSQATATSINALRMAFQIQRLFERDACGGSRYTELVRAHFGISSPDARLQRTEYLGGKRMPLNIQQVINQANTEVQSIQTPLGDVAGMSVTADYDFDFTKSFTEHGYVIGVCCVRYDHTYQQGLNRLWSRKNRFDFYWPALSHLGNMAVLNEEILAQGTSTDKEVFGYQDRWADYRYKPSMCTGQMRSTYAAPLDNWHFGDEYSSLPVLSDAWIREDKSNVDRTLAVTSATANQIFGDFFFDCYTTRCMPLYSVPGMIDHF